MDLLTNIYIYIYIYTHTHMYLDRNLLHQFYIEESVKECFKLNTRNINKESCIILILKSWINWGKIILLWRYILILFRKNINRIRNWDLIYTLDRSDGHYLGEEMIKKLKFIKNAI